MPAPKRISDERIRQVIVERRGIVSQAAIELGMDPKSLRDRLRRLGIDLEAVRSKRPGGVYGVVEPEEGHSGMSGGVGHIGAGGVPWVGRGAAGEVLGAGRGTSGEVDGEQNESGVYPISGKAPNFPAVPSAAAEPDVEVPIRTKRPSIRPARLRPHNEDRLTEGRRDLEAQYRVDSDNELILNQFFEEAFETWLRSKLGASATPAAASRKKTAKDRPGDEGAR